MSIMSAVDLSKGLIVDFTNSIEGAKKFAAYNDQVKETIRNFTGTKVLVLIDKAQGSTSNSPLAVRDHINLSGSNPLVGPNDPVGTRFPILKDMYLAESMPDLGSGIAVGLAPGIVPDAEAIAFIKSIGGDFWGYNLVPAAIVAAHAGFKVLGIVVPEGISSDTTKNVIAKLL